MPLVQIKPRKCENHHGTPLIVYCPGWIWESRLIAGLAVAGTLAVSAGDPRDELSLSVARSAHLISRYRPRAPIIAVTRNGQTARQCHLYRGIFPVQYTKPAHDVWAEDVDLRVNFAMEMGKARGFFKEGDVVIVLTGWRPGSGYTNTMRVVPVV